MTTFQLITIPLLACAVIVTAVAISRRRLAPRVGLMWLALWSAALVSIAVPELLVRIAHALGIGRGADLVLYVSILFTLGGFFLIYLRFRRLDEALTQIVRHLAIRDADEPPGDDQGP